MLLINAGELNGENAPVGCEPEDWVRTRTPPGP
jgi:hypothetical protein